jgi:Transposase DDE domain
VSTLYFETDAGDGFRESGFSKERWLGPQITIGLLTGADGFPLMVSAFEGNRAETKTMLPVIEAFMAAHGLPDVTIVADAGMVSEANQKQIEAAGLSFILGMKIPDMPYVVKQWRREHPGQDIPNGTIFTQRWAAGPTAAAVTRSSTTSTKLTAPAGRCAASTSRSPRPSRPWPARHR